jgi:acyl dehydratase
VRAVVLEARLSKSKPELGVMRTRTEVHNQNHELVLSSTAANFIRRRPAGKT